MNYKNSYENKSMYCKRVYGNSKFPRAHGAPCAVVYALKVLLCHVANTVNQHQYADRVFIGHFQFAGHDLEVQTGGHRRTAGGLEGRY